MDVTRKSEEMQQESQDKRHSPQKRVADSTEDPDQSASNVDSSYKSGKRQKVTDVEKGRENEDGPKTKGRQEANPKQGPSTSEEREESINLQVKKGNPENDELELLANDINPEDWKKVARKLKIDDPKITAIHKENEECYEKIYTMLRKWKQKNGRAATWEKLHQALVGAELGELAEKHCCEKVN